MSMVKGRRDWGTDSNAGGSVLTEATTTASERRRIREAGLGLVYWFSYVCAISSLVLVFTAFASPYWFKSWGRVHSPLANVGMWQICLSGWVKPRDPTLRSYVGCWWIHSTFFEEVFDDIMPPWFRAVQALVIFTLLCCIAVVFLMSFYMCESYRMKYYEPRKLKMFMIIAALFFASGVLVLICSFVFAFKAKDPNWMPRPWLSYFSFSFGFYVLSGFFSAFGGLASFIKSTDIRKKKKRGVTRVHDKHRPPPPPAASQLSSAPPPPGKTSESFV